jgi:SulP family sulfate permease
MIGFVNALAILIFLAQLPELTNVPKLTYLMVAGGLLLIYVAPRFVKFIPSPLICIVVLTCLSILFDLNVRTVDDMGELPASLPLFLLPDIPITLETFLIIFPYSAAIASVGLLESLMTATIIDDLTDTSSDKNRECVGQGIANCATGFIGGMAGCAMIGQSVINIKSGGRGRLSSLCAGVFLLILCVGLGDWVRQIPMAALVSVMIMVSISTFNWSSIKNLKTNPKSSSVVMLATVATVVLSHNLAIGVLVGVLLSGLFFSSKISKTFKLTSTLSKDEETRIYLVQGQVFFASVTDFVSAFNFKETISQVVIDVKNAHIWDVSSVAALDTVMLKFQRNGIDVQVIGLNQGSEKIVRKHSAHKNDDILISM